ncbi:MAG: TIGR01777 family oxidoreductase [Sedimentisphaerales bacterium]|nr:TIGR01777 family oxidoreductase [Sedimentisphaerales bacterium]
MRVVIAGATGFIGRALCRELHRDCQVVALSRDRHKANGLVGEYARVVEWNALTGGTWTNEIDAADAVVNLAGENIAARRWSRSRKADILQSRSHSIAAIIDAIETIKTKPKVFVQASAVGYYGARGDETLDEDAGAGSGFLAEVCRRVEIAAARAEHFGVRTVIIRSGMVLGPDGGALPKLMRPFRYFVGGHVGSGRQWVSWISLPDELRAIRFLIKKSKLQGVFNLTAPDPVRMKMFCRTLGRVMGRPAWTFVPAFALRLALGQMADEALLNGQKVVPRRLTEAGFQFEHPDLAGALKVVVRGDKHESA